jgi:hypothetical protein
MTNDQVRAAIAVQRSSFAVRRGWLIAGFAPIVVLALAADSRLLLDRGFDGQFLSNLAAPLYFLLVLAGLRRDERLMALVFVPFSALGEAIFSLLFQLYTYKFEAIPLYVPFGHAILFSTGLMIADLPLVRANQARVRWALLAFHAGLFVGAALALGDTLSAIFGTLFVVILARKRCRPFYLIMGVLVLYIELLGTALGCWAWEPRPFGVLRTTNPPVGAFVCYVIADILVMKLARRIANLIARQRWYTTGVVWPRDAAGYVLCNRVRAMLLSGTKDARLRAVRVVDIHGTRFYDLEYTHDDAPEQVRAARIGCESAYEQPRPGDAVSVSYLMNVVTSIARR